MSIQISSLHLENSPEMRSYAQKKIAKLIRYHPHVVDINVKLISEKSHRGQEKDYYCEITIHLPHKILEIVDSERAMDKAIDKAVERAKRTLVRTKEKELTKKHKDGIFSKFFRRK